MLYYGNKYPDFIVYQTLFSNNPTYLEPFICLSVLNNVLISVYVYIIVFLKRYANNKQLKMFSKRYCKWCA